MVLALQITEHSISRIPVSAHEKNSHEQNVCIKWSKMMIDDDFSLVLTDEVFI